MDERYRSNGIEVSKWLNELKKTYRKLDDLESDLSTFFKMNCPEWTPQTVSTQ